MASIYDPQPEDVLVDADRLRSLCKRLYQQVGLSLEDATAVADIQVWTDLRGVCSHGTRLLPGYVRALQEGRYNPGANVAVLREGRAYLVLDGDHGIGHPVARKGMELAIEKARQNGVGVVGIANSAHFGAASAYSTIAAEQGMIGFITSNSGGPALVPYGGREPATANNPLSWAVPADPEPPVVLDMACAVAAGNRVKTLQLYGRPLPDGWMVTKDGRPARDWSEAAYMLPAAGPKGYGTALVMSALGLLSGGLMPLRKTGAFAQEQFLMALDINAFGDRAQFLAEMARCVRDIRAIPPAEGFDRVYLPGEIEWLRSQRWRQTGIPLHRDHVAVLEHTAAGLGVPVPWSQT